MENVTKVNEIENAEVTVCENEKPKHNWLTKGGKFAKKAVMMATIASCMVHFADCTSWCDDSDCSTAIITLAGPDYWKFSCI